MKVRRRFSLGLLFLAGVVGANLAFARDRDAYLGFGLGRSDDRALNDNDTGFKLLGGLRFNKYVALEGLPTNLGTLGAESVEKRGFVLQALGILPVSTRFELFAKTGFFDWEARRGRSGFKVDDGTDLTHGAGLFYHFGKRWSLRAEWERFTEVHEGDVDSMSVSAVLWFAL